MSQVATCDQRAFTDTKMWRKSVTDTKMWRKKCHILVSVTLFRSQVTTCDIGHWTIFTMIYWRGSFTLDQYNLAKSYSTAAAAAAETVLWLESVCREGSEQQQEEYEQMLAVSRAHSRRWSAAGLYSGVDSRCWAVTSQRCALTISQIEREVNREGYWLAHHFLATSAKK